MKPKGKPNWKGLLRGTAAALGAVVFLLCYPMVLPVAQSVLGQAALFSTALTMPQGAMEALRDRFQGDVSQDAPEDHPPDDEPGPEVEQGLPSSSSQSSDSSQAEHPGQQGKGTPPEVPEEYQSPLVSKLMVGEKENPAFIPYGEAWVRNYTKLTTDEIQKVLKTQAALSISGDSGPQVLIYHTHTTESYEDYDRKIYDNRNTWRSEDNTKNMAAVGEILTGELERQGISVIHDTEQHDYPSYNGAYDRSKETVQEYLKRYPSIKVAIDVHRDAIIYEDGSVVKPVVEIGGKKAAQLMMVAPCDDGTVKVPKWQENFRFAAELADHIEKTVPGITRPIFFCYRNYNLNLTTGSLLFEIGTNGNTLEEAEYTARLIAQPMAEYLKAHIS